MTSCLTDCELKSCVFHNEMAQLQFQAESGNCCPFVFASDWPLQSLGPLGSTSLDSPFVIEGRPRNLHVLERNPPSDSGSDGTEPLAHTMSLPSIGWDRLTFRDHEGGQLSDPPRMSG